LGGQEYKQPLWIWIWKQYLFLIKISHIISVTASLVLFRFFANAKIPHFLLSFCLICLLFLLNRSIVLTGRFAKIEWVSIYKRCKFSVYFKHWSGAENSHTHDLRAFGRQILTLRVTYENIIGLWRSGQPLHLVETSGQFLAEQRFDIQKMIWLKIWNIYSSRLE
jgi:hypothetical protein